MSDTINIERCLHLCYITSRLHLHRRLSERYAMAANTNVENSQFKRLDKHIQVWIDYMVIFVNVTHVCEGVVVDLCESLQQCRLSEVIVGH